MAGQARVGWDWEKGRAGVTVRGTGAAISATGAQGLPEVRGSARRGGGSGVKGGATGAAAAEILLGAV